LNWSTPLTKFIGFPSNNGCTRLRVCALASLAQLSNAGFQSDDPTARFATSMERTCANANDGLTQSFGNFHLAAQGSGVSDKSHVVSLNDLNGTVSLMTQWAW
jgi:hypothetical protein